MSKCKGASGWEETHLHQTPLWFHEPSAGDLASVDAFSGNKVQPVARNGAVLQCEPTEHAPWRPFRRGEPTEGANRSHDRRGECACGGKKKKRGAVVRHILALSPPPHPSLFLSNPLSLPHSPSDAFFSSMEAMRRKQVWCFLEKRHVSFTVFTLGWLVWFGLPHLLLSCRWPSCLSGALFSF